MEDLQSLGGLFLIGVVRSEECVYRNLVIVASKVYVNFKFHHCVITVLGHRALKSCGQASPMVYIVGNM
jgi:hypothetical protein